MLSLVELLGRTEQLVQLVQPHPLGPQELNCAHFVFAGLLLIYRFCQSVCVSVLLVQLLLAAVGTVVFKEDYFWAIYLVVDH